MRDGWRGGVPADEKQTVYSLGVMLWEMIALWGESRTRLYLSNEMRIFEDWERTFRTGHETFFRPYVRREYGALSNAVAAATKNDPAERPTLQEFVDLLRL